MEPGQFAFIKLLNYTRKKKEILLILIMQDAVKKHVEPKNLYAPFRFLNCIQNYPVQLY